MKKITEIKKHFWIYQRLSESRKFQSYWLDVHVSKESYYVESHGRCVYGFF